MTSVFKQVEDPRSQSLLVIGTENQDIIILDKQNTKVQKQIRLKSVPVFIVTSGSFDIESKIYCACRNGSVYLIKNGELSQSFSLQIESKPIGLLRLDKNIVLAGMNCTMYNFYNKGRLNFTK